MSIKVDPNQKGFSQILILVILTLGLAVTYYVVNYTQTNLKPKAYENNVTDNQSIPQNDKPLAGGGCGFIYACEQGQAVIYSSIKSNDGNLQRGSCTRADRQPINKTCVDYYCENIIYSDPNVKYVDHSGQEVGGGLVHKYATSHDNYRCNYKFVNIPQFSIPITSPDNPFTLEEKCPSEVYCDSKVKEFIHKHVKTEDAFNNDGSCKYQFDNANVQCSGAAIDYYDRNYLADDLERAKLEIKYGIVQVPQDSQIRSGAEEYTSRLCKPGEKYYEYEDGSAYYHSDDLGYYCLVCNSTGRKYEYGERTTGRPDPNFCK